MTVIRQTSGETWYVEARNYPTALMAKTAWEHAEDKLTLGRGEEGVGVFRLAPNPDGDTIRSGLEEPMHSVVAVTRDRRTAERVAHVLKDGTPWDPVPEFCDALIERRRRMTRGRLAWGLSHKPGGGKVVIRRPEDGGGRIYESGELREPKPGRG